MTPAACILGCSGASLTKAELAFFRDARPWGFVLFARNVEDPAQLRRLTRELRESVGRADAPILRPSEPCRTCRWP